MFSGSFSPPNLTKERIMLFRKIQLEDPAQARYRRSRSECKGR
jgi:hypothetical protein